MKFLTLLHSRDIFKFAKNVDYLKKGFEIISAYKIRFNFCPLGGFICTFSLSISLSITLWTSKFTSSSRCNWIGISTGNSNGTDKRSFISFQYSKRDEYKSYILFYVKTTTNKFWNDAEMFLKSFWTSHLQIMNWLEPLF